MSNRKSVGSRVLWGVFFAALFALLGLSGCGGGGAMDVTPATSPTSSPTSSPPDTTRPTVPTTLTATAVSASQINLSWTASTDNVAVTGYKVYRDGSLLATLGVVTTYQNSGLTQSTL